MYTVEYHQNLIDMLYYTAELNRFLFGVKLRKLEVEEPPDKIEIYSSLKMLTSINYRYNKNDEKYSFTIGINDGIGDIHLDSYETFKEIIKKIDKNELNVSLEEINFAQSINHNWFLKFSEKDKTFTNFFDKSEKNN